MQVNPGMVRFMFSVPKNPWQLPQINNRAYRDKTHIMQTHRSRFLKAKQYIYSKNYFNTSNIGPELMFFFLTTPPFPQRIHPKIWQLPTEVNLANTLKFLRTNHAEQRCRSFRIVLILYVISETRKLFRILKRQSLSGHSLKGKSLVGRVLSRGLDSGGCSTGGEIHFHFHYVHLPRNF